MTEKTYIYSDQVPILLNFHNFLHIYILTIALHNLTLNNDDKIYKTKALKSGDRTNEHQHF